MDWKRNVLLQASRLGVAEGLLRTYDNLKGIDGWDFDVDSEVREFSLRPNEVHGNVLLPLTQGEDLTISYSYCVLAHAFRTRGYQPVLPLCHNDLELCLRKESDFDNRSTCAICHSYGQKLLDAFGLEPIAMNEFLPADFSPPSIAEDEAQSVTYRGIDISRYAKATARRFLKKRLLDYEDPYEFGVFRKLLQASQRLVEVANRLLDDYHVSAVISHHPMYIYGGIYLAVAEQRGIPAASVAPGYNDQTLIFGNQRNRAPIPQFTDEEFLRQVLEEPLSEVEKAETKQTMDGRVDGSTVRVHPASTANRSITVPDERTVLAVFTNLMWDASLEADNIVFSNVYTWVSSTIEYFTHVADVTLVIKPHPAEHLRDTQEGMAEWLRSNYDPLPDNVELLDPDTDVSPYELIQDIDVGVVFNSTLGLEMAYRGIPVVVASDTHYRGLGFTYDPETITEYFDLLDRAEDLEVDETMLVRAHRYAHFLFREKQIDFPFYRQNDLDIELLPVTQEVIMDAADKFDVVVDNVLSDDPIVPR